MVDSVKVQPPLFVFNLATIRAFLDPFKAIFEVGVRSKNFFGTYLCKQSTLVLEVQPYNFVFDSATLWASFGHFFLAPWGYFCFGPFGAILRQR